MSIWTRLSLLCLAGLLFVGGAYLTNRERARDLERQLLETRTELERLHIDHRDTLDAITSALDAREAIHEQARLREKRLQKTLEKDPLAAMPLSDDLRMCLQWDAENRVCLDAPTGPASGHRDTGPQESANGR